MFTGSSINARTFIVDQKHPKASDSGPAIIDVPLKTISKAAELAYPGDSVVVYAGIYREQVMPIRGGEPGRPIVYMAAPGEEVFIKGSEV